MRLNKWILLFTVLIGVWSAVQGATYDELGADQLKAPALTQLRAAYPHQTLVLEFFSFGCHACHAFEPTMQAWLLKKPRGVSFIRVPVVFHSAWLPLARAYYVAEALGLHSTLDPALFAAIHEQKIPLSTEAAVRALFLEHGVEAQTFDKLYASFTVDRQLELVESLSRVVGLRSVPTIMVLGRSQGYLTNTEKSGGDPQQVVATLEELLQKERRARLRHSKPVPLTPVAAPPNGN